MMNSSLSALEGTSMKTSTNCLHRLEARLKQDTKTRKDIHFLQPKGKQLAETELRDKVDVSYCSFLIYI